MQAEQSQSPIQSRLASASIASAASFIVTLLQSVVMVPLLLTSWSPRVYGEWVLVMSVFGMATAFDAGLQNYVGNLFAMAAGDRKRVHQWLGSGIRAVAITASALAVTVIVYGLANGKLGRSTLVVNDVNSFRSLCILLAYWIAIGSVGGVASRLYAAHGLQSRSLWLSVMQRLAMALALAFAAWCGAGLLLASFAFAMAGVAVGLVTFRDICFQFPHYRPWLGAGSWGEAFRLVGRASGVMVVGALDSIGFAVLVSLTEAWSSASAVAVFGAVRTVSSAIMQASAVILTPLAPDLSRFGASRDGYHTSAMLASAWLIATGPIALASTLLLPVAEFGFEKWTRGALGFPSTLIIALISSVLVRQWTSPLTMLLFCLNAVRPQFVVSLGRCLSTLATAGISFTFLGVSGMGLAILVGELTAAMVTVTATGLVYPDLCDRRCIRGSALALGQIVAAATTIAIWWCDTSLRWESLLISTVFQVAVMVVQWFNLHSIVRERIVLLFGLRNGGLLIQGRPAIRPEKTCPKDGRRKVEDL